jgi:cation-transporting ATPase 13A1
MIVMFKCRLEAAGDGPGAYHTPGSQEADGEFEWVSPDESARIAYSRSWDDLLLLAAEYDLCLTGALE